MNELAAAVELLKTRRSFLIACHVNPDGDCLGSMCALGLALERNGKSVILVSPDGLPEVYRFLPGSKAIVREVPPGAAFEAVIVVDCEGLDRLGIAEQAVRSCDSVLEIDHHPEGERGKGVHLIRPSAAAAGELVFELLQAAGFKIDSDIAECLLTAVVTDTGSFRFSNVRPATLRVAAALLECGASIHKVARSVYESRSLSSTKILGMALSNLRTTRDGRIAWAYITRDCMDKSGASEAETEGIVNHIRAIRGAQVGLLFKEERDGTTRVSLRSRDGLDISQVARLFGGGGHKTAAGCTLEQSLVDAQGLVLDAVRKWMGC